MIFINYNGSLKKDLEKIHNNWKLNVKSFLCDGLLSLCAAACSFGVSKDVLVTGLVTCGIVTSSVLVSSLLEFKKYRKIETDKKEAMKKVGNLSWLLQVSDVPVPTVYLEDALVSKEFVNYIKPDTGEQSREEIVSYYIKTKRKGEIARLVEMRNELAGYLSTGYAAASLEITNENSALVPDDNYGLYLEEGWEYNNIDSNDDSKLKL